MDIFRNQLDVFAAAFDAIGGGGDQKFDGLDSVAAQNSAAYSENFITLTKELDPSSSSLAKPAAGVRAGILGTSTLGTVAGVGTNRQFFIPVLLNNKDRSDFNSSASSTSNNNNNNNAGVSISSDANVNAKVVSVEKCSLNSADEKTGQTSFASCSTGNVATGFPASNASPPSQKELEDIIDRWSLELIDDAVVGACFEIHRSVKSGVFSFEDVDLKVQSEQFPIEANPNTDVFGQPLYASGSARAPECKCPECNRPIAASRFAPHLEKCMGLGRSSYRKASKRIAASTAASALSRYANIEDYSYLDDDDEEWTTSSNSKRSGGGQSRSNRSRPSRAKTASNPPPTVAPPAIAGNSLRNQQQQQPQNRSVALQQGMALRSSGRTSAVSSASDSPQVAQDARSTTSSPGVECLGTFVAADVAEMHLLTSAVKTRSGSRRNRAHPPPTTDLYEFKDEDSPVSVNM